jgi:hypothetical protein
MKNNTGIKRSAKSGRFVTKPLGVSKASKFALVEGMTLSKKNLKAFAECEAIGLKGDALRSAISGSFQKKRG